MSCLLVSCRLLTNELMLQEVHVGEKPLLVDVVYFSVVSDEAPIYIHRL